MRILLLLITSSFPMHSSGRNLHEKYRKRSTESQGSVGPPDDVSFKREDRIPEVGAQNLFKPPDDGTFKREDRNPSNRNQIDDAFKPFDDFTRKQEDLFPETAGDRVKVSDDAGAPPSFAFNLPPWLMFFKPIWDEIVSKENDLRVQFPTEFESENDITEMGTETGWAEGGFGTTSDDATEIEGTEATTEWAFGEAAEFPEAPQLPGIFEAPENNFEWAGTELPEHSEAFTPDDTEYLQQGVDNTEKPEATFEVGDDVHAPEVKTEIESAWDHGSNWNHRPFVFTGNWMQGMVNTAMGVLHGQGDAAPNDDAADRLNHAPFESAHRQEEDQDSSAGGITQTVVNDMNHGMMLMNPFANVSPAFVNTETNFNGQFEHHNVPDNEHDSSS